MNDTKNQATPTGKIPVLFDIVERGKFAPAENMIKPPPKGGAVFNLDDVDTGSECPTILPEPPSNQNSDVTEFSLDELEDATDEIPIIPASMLETDSTEFSLDPSEAVTGEMSTIPKAMLELSKTQNELIDQVMQKLMPHLEELALETVQRIINSSQDTEAADEDKEPSS